MSLQNRKQQPQPKSAPAPVAKSAPSPGGLRKQTKTKTKNKGWMLQLCSFKLDEKSGRSYDFKGIMLPYPEQKQYLIHIASPEGEKYEVTYNEACVLFLAAMRGGERPTMFFFKDSEEFRSEYADGDSWSSNFRINVEKYMYLLDRPDIIDQIQSLIDSPPPAPEQSAEEVDYSDVEFDEEGNELPF